MTTSSDLKTDKFYIGGEWVTPDSSKRSKVINPATGETFASVPVGTAKDADRAVLAARKAFLSWSETSPTERADTLQRLVDEITARTDELTDLLVNNIGMPPAATTALQVQIALNEAQAQIDTLRTMEFEETIGTSLLVKEAIGVVVAITPWNFPLVQAFRKIIPALAAGCTVVLKPAELTPLDTFVLSEAADAAGLPAGVFNFVTGEGTVVGEALIAHPTVDMISLTGSTAAGRRISEVASRDIKRVSLELGGKSPSVVLDDADLESAVGSTLGWCFINSGQLCSAQTRLLVPRPRLKEAEQVLIDAIADHKVGAADEEGVTMGPLISQPQQTRVLEYLQKGADEGARVLIGGVDAQPKDGPGYFVEPTVFTDVRPGMTIEQEEIFGPVLVVVPYDTEDEAADIANGTDYGLAAAVWSGDKDRATAFARRIRAGQVEVNGGPANPLAPFGGYKQSGIGREVGQYGIEEFLEVKSLQL